MLPMDVPRITLHACAEAGGWDQAKTSLLPFCLFCPLLLCSRCLCTVVSYLTFFIWDNQRCRDLLVSLLKPPTLSKGQGLWSRAQLSLAEPGWGWAAQQLPAAGSTLCSLHCPAWDTLVFTPVLILLFSKVHTLLPSLSAFDGWFVFCYLQQAPALPRNLLPSISCPLHPHSTTALPCDPRKISQLPLLRTQTLCIKSLLISHITPFLGEFPSSESATIVLISAPPLPCVPRPKCALLAPTTHSGPEEQWGFPKPLCKPLCPATDWRGQAQMSPTHTAMPPLPGQVASPGNTGVGAGGIFCHSPSPPARILLEELIFQPVSSGASLRATWWTKGTFSNLFTRRRSTWEN